MALLVINKLIQTHMTIQSIMKTITKTISMLKMTMAEEISSSHG